MFADKLLDYLADFVTYMYNHQSELSDEDLYMVDRISMAVEQMDIFQVSSLDLSYFESFMENCNDEIVFHEWRVARDFLA